MKIAITGHTSGIGKSCFDLLSSKHNVFGYSRSNGWDISNIEMICQDLIHNDFDIVINNAYFEDCQVKILQRMYEEWKNTNKKIISMGSVVTDHLHFTSKDGEDYTLYKRMLEDAHNRRTVGNTCQSILVKPAQVDTPLMREDNVQTILSPLEVANVIEFIINSPENVYVSQLTVWPKKSV